MVNAIAGALSRVLAGGQLPVAGGVRLPVHPLLDMAASTGQRIFRKEEHLIDAARTTSL